MSASVTHERGPAVARTGRRAYLGALIVAQPLLLVAYFSVGRWTAGFADFYDRTYLFAHLALVAAVLFAREGAAERRWGRAALGTFAALCWVALWFVLEYAPLAGQVGTLPAACRALMSL